MSRSKIGIPARVSLVILAALLLMFVARVTTLRPTHPYPAPDFTLRDLNGNAVRLSSFRGKGVVLNFWATWCAPCRKEIPWFIQLQKEYGPQGLQIIGISMDEGGSKAVEQFDEKAGIDYPILLDDGHASALYGGAEILPTTYYISRSGEVIAFVKGVIGKSAVERNIRETLEEPAGADGQSRSIAAEATAASGSESR